MGTEDRQEQQETTTSTGEISQHQLKRYGEDYSFKHHEGQTLWA